jgi:hypothetical protein
MKNRDIFNLLIKNIIRENKFNELSEKIINEANEIFYYDDVELLHYDDPEEVLKIMGVDYEK